jgi:hypothetical protein
VSVKEDTVSAKSLRLNRGGKGTWGEKGRGERGKEEGVRLQRPDR